MDVVRLSICLIMLTLYYNNILTIVFLLLSIITHHHHYIYNHVMPLVYSLPSKMKLSSLQANFHHSNLFLTDQVRTNLGNLSILVHLVPFPGAHACSSTMMAKTLKTLWVSVDSEKEYLENNLVLCTLQIELASTLDPAKVSLLKVRTNCQKDAIILYKPVQNYWIK